MSRSRVFVKGSALNQFISCLLVFTFAFSSIPASALAAPVATTPTDTPDVYDTFTGDKEVEATYLDTLVKDGSLAVPVTADVTALEAAGHDGTVEAEFAGGALIFGDDLDEAIRLYGEEAAKAAEARANDAADAAANDATGNDTADAAAVTAGDATVSNAASDAAAAGSIDAATDAAADAANAAATDATTNTTNTTDGTAPDTDTTGAAASTTTDATADTNAASSQVRYQFGATTSTAAYNLQSAATATQVAGTAADASGTTPDTDTAAAEAPALTAPAGASSATQAVVDAIAQSPLAYQRAYLYTTDTNAQVTDENGDPIQVVAADKRATDGTVRYAVEGRTEVFELGANHKIVLAYATPEEAADDAEANGTDAGTENAEEAIDAADESTDADALAPLSLNGGVSTYASSTVQSVKFDFNSNNDWTFHNNPATGLAGAAAYTYNATDMVTPGGSGVQQQLVSSTGIIAGVPRAISTGESFSRDYLLFDVTRKDTGDTKWNTHLKEWNTNSEGKGTTIVAGETNLQDLVDNGQITADANGQVTLYAIWESRDLDFTLTAQDASDGPTTADGTAATHDASLTASRSTGLTPKVGNTENPTSFAMSLQVSPASGDSLASQAANTPRLVGAKWYPDNTKRSDFYGHIVAGDNFDMNVNDAELYFDRYDGAPVNLPDGTLRLDLESNSRAAEGTFEADLELEFDMGTQEDGWNSKKTVVIHLTHNVARVDRGDWFYSVDYENEMISFMGDNMDDAFLTVSNMFDQAVTVETGLQAPFNTGMPLEAYLHNADAGSTYTWTLEAGETSTFNGQTLRFDLPARPEEPSLTSTVSSDGNDGTITATAPAGMTNAEFQYAAVDRSGVEPAADAWRDMSGNTVDVPAGQYAVRVKASYAQNFAGKTAWIGVGKQWTVSFKHVDEEGNEVTPHRADDDSANPNKPLLCDDGDRVKLPTGTDVISLLGYTLVGVKYSEYGDVSMPTNDTSNPITGTTTIYYVWERSSATVHFFYEHDASSLVRWGTDGNGAQPTWMMTKWDVFAYVSDTMGTLPSSSTTENESGLQAPFYREGYRFTGWNTRPHGDGMPVDAGSPVREVLRRANVPAGQTDVPLYAQWEPVDYALTGTLGNPDAADQKWQATYGSITNSDSGTLSLSKSGVTDPRVIGVTVKSATKDGEPTVSYVDKFTVSPIAPFTVMDATDNSVTVAPAADLGAGEYTVVLEVTYDGGTDGGTDIGENVKPLEVSGTFTVQKADWNLDCSVDYVNETITVTGDLGDSFGDSSASAHIVGAPTDADGSIVYTTESDASGTASLTAALDSGSTINGTALDNKSAFSNYWGGNGSEIKLYLQRQGDDNHNATVKEIALKSRADAAKNYNAVDTDFDNVPAFGEGAIGTLRLKDQNLDNRTWVFRAHQDGSDTDWSDAWNRLGAGSAQPAGTYQVRAYADQDSSLFASRTVEVRIEQYYRVTYEFELQDVDGTTPAAGSERAQELLDNFYVAKLLNVNGDILEDLTVNNAAATRAAFDSVWNDPTESIGNASWVLADTLYFMPVFGQGNTVSQPGVTINAGYETPGFDLVGLSRTTGGATTKVTEDNGVNEDGFNSSYKVGYLEGISGDTTVTATFKMRTYNADWDITWLGDTTELGNGQEVNTGIKSLPSVQQNLAWTSNVATYLGLFTDHDGNEHDVDTWPKDLDALRSLFGSQAVADNGVTADKGDANGVRKADGTPGAYRDEAGTRDPESDKVGFLTAADDKSIDPNYVSKSYWKLNPKDGSETEVFQVASTLSQGLLNIDPAKFGGVRDADGNIDYTASTTWRTMNTIQFVKTFSAENKGYLLDFFIGGSDESLTGTVDTGDALAFENGNGQRYRASNVFADDKVGNATVRLRTTVGDGVEQPEHYVMTGYYAAAEGTKIANDRVIDEKTPIGNQAVTYNGKAVNTDERWNTALTVQDNLDAIFPDGLVDGSTANTPSEFKKGTNPYPGDYDLDADGNVRWSDVYAHFQARIENADVKLATTMPSTITASADAQEYTAVINASQLFTSPSGKKSGSFQITEVKLVNSASAWAHDFTVATNACTIDANTETVNVPFKVTATQKASLSGKLRVTYSYTNTEGEATSGLTKDFDVNVAVSDAGETVTDGTYTAQAVSRPVLRSTAETQFGESVSSWNTNLVKYLGLTVQEKKSDGSWETLDASSYTVEIADRTGGLTAAELVGKSVDFTFNVTINGTSTMLTSQATLYLFDNGAPEQDPVLFYDSLNTTVPDKDTAAGASGYSTGLFSTLTDWLKEKANIRAYDPNNNYAPATVTITSAANVTTSNGLLVAGHNATDQVVIKQQPINDDLRTSKVTNVDSDTDGLYRLSLTASVSSGSGATTLGQTYVRLWQATATPKVPEQNVSWTTCEYGEYRLGFGWSSLDASKSVIPAMSTYQPWIEYRYSTDGTTFYSGDMSRNTDGITQIRDIDGKKLTPNTKVYVQARVMGNGVYADGSWPTDATTDNTSEMWTMPSRPSRYTGHVAIDFDKETAAPATSKAEGTGGDNGNIVTVIIGTVNNADQLSDTVLDVSELANG